jgi:hypothetical protein
MSGSAGAAGGGNTPTVTFSEIYPMIMSGCTCHATGQGGLNTSSKMTAYMNLVNADSRSCRGVKRVTPNQPDQSVLYLALEHSSMGMCSPPAMPRGGNKWDQASLDKLKAWIEAGAKLD